MVSTILSQLAGGYSIEKILEGYTQLRREQVIAAIEYALALVRDEEVEVVSARGNEISACGYYSPSFRPPNS